jgi:hypothetical protein
MEGANATQGEILEDNPQNCIDRNFSALQIPATVMAGQCATPPGFLILYTFSQPLRAGLPSGRASGAGNGMILGVVAPPEFSSRNRMD